MLFTLIDERLVSIMSTIKAIYGDRVSEHIDIFTLKVLTVRDFVQLLFLSFLRVKSVKNEWGR